MDSMNNLFSLTWMIPIVIVGLIFIGRFSWATRRSEEHTSELQSPCNLVCRLLLEKKKHSLTLLATHLRLLSKKRSNFKRVPQFIPPPRSVQVPTRGLFCRLSGPHHWYSRRPLSHL